MRTAWKVALSVAALLVLLLGVFLWKPGVRMSRPATTPPGQYSLAQLRQLPEEHLFYPGGEVISQMGRENSPSMPGRQRTVYSGYRVGSQATAAELEAFYHQRLQELAWGPMRPGDVFPTTAEERATGWRKGDLVFRFSILKKAHPLAPPEELTRKYTTIYDIKVIFNP